MDKPPINIAEIWDLEAYFEDIQFRNWITRYVKRHIFEDGLSEQESKVASGGERILFSELACIPDLYEEE
jgi:hypothetical protein